MAISTSQSWCTKRRFRFTLFQQTVCLLLQLFLIISNIFISHADPLINPGECLPVTQQQNFSHTLERSSIRKSNLFYKHKLHCAKILPLSSEIRKLQRKHSQACRNTWSELLNYASRQPMDHGVSSSIEKIWDPPPPCNAWDWVHRKLYQCSRQFFQPAALESSLNTKI